MATFEITSPDGGKFEVTAPEGATQEQVLSYAKSQFSNDKSSNVPRETHPNQAEQMSEGDRRLTAVGRSLMKPVEAIQQGAAHLRDALPSWMPAGALASVVAGGKTTKEADAEAVRNAQAMQDVERASTADSKTRPPLVNPIMPGADTINAIGRMTAGGVETATDVATGAMLPGLAAAKGATMLPRVAAGAGTGAAYSTLNPVTSGKDFAEEKTKQGLFGGIAGGGLAGLLNGLSRAIPAIKERFTKTEPKPQTTEGADTVAKELQYTRDLTEGKPVTANIMTGLSDAEKARGDWTRATQTFRETLKSPQTVDVQPALKRIEDLLVGKAIDARVRSALEEARDTINRALDNAGGNIQTIQTAAGPMMVQGGKLVPAKVPTGVPLDLADEIRQSIGRQIDDKGEKRLTGFTKGLLEQVKSDVVGKTPTNYQKALTDLAAANKALEKYSATDTVLGKTTIASDLDKLTGMDAQAAINEALSGKRSARDLTQLVALTKHDPATAEGLRSAFANWLQPQKSTGGIDTGKVVERWAKSRDTVRDSGMFAPDHFKAIEKVIADIQASKRTEGIREITGSAVGFMLGAARGHPWVGASMGRRAAGKLSPATESNLDVLVRDSINDPAVAQLLSGPVTPQTLPALNALAERIIPVAGRESGEQTPKRRKDPLALEFQP